MKINDPKASYAQVHGIFLSPHFLTTDTTGPLVHVKPGSLKVDNGMLTFTAITSEDQVESLYVPVSERLANR